MANETLVRAARNTTDKYINEREKQTAYLEFINGAKWQAERMYSEEELLEFANWCRIQDNKYPNRVITIQQLIEQFKKNNNDK